jgi:hypothetical protein
MWLSLGQRACAREDALAGLAGLSQLLAEIGTRLRPAGLEGLGGVGQLGRRLRLTLDAVPDPLLATARHDADVLRRDLEHLLRTLTRLAEAKRRLEG